MLLRIDDTTVIKSDRYCFMQCVDKGLTKFPGGVQSIYFKPVKFYGSFSNLGPDLSADKRVATAIDCFNDFKNFVNGLKLKSEAFEFLGYKIKYDKDCFQASVGSNYTLYHSTANAAVIDCLTQHLRSDKKFGHNEQDLVYGTFESIMETISSCKTLVSGIE
jgi:hypothetical protein